MIEYDVNTITEPLDVTYRCILDATLEINTIP